MRVGLVSQKPKLWWLTLAVLTNPGTADADLAWASSLRDVHRLGEVDRLLVSSDMLEGNALGVDVAVRDRALVLWDGVFSLEELASGLRAETADWPCRYVGDVPGQQFPRADSTLLFDQHPEAYRRFARTLRTPRTFGQLPDGAKLFLRSRSMLLTAKHAKQAPRDVPFDRRTLIFAGQSGRFSLARFVGPDTAAIARVCDTLVRFEQGHQVRPLVSDGLDSEYDRTVAARSAWDRYVFISSLMRGACLIALRASGLACEFRFHPAPNINYYQSLLRRRAVYLDFGGANGDELIYPRAADLLVLGKRAVSVRPPKHLLDATGAEVARDLAALVEQVVETCHEALSGALPAPSVTTDVGR